MLEAFFRVLGSELKMQMVVYGIGSIESYEPPQLQLSLAILLKRKFSWIGDIEVLDPILSVTELVCWKPWVVLFYQLMSKGRQQASKPTPFFMPHCEAELYDNLFQANWRTERLNNIVLFGTSLGHINSMHQSLGAQLMLIPRGISWLFESSRVNLQ
ncbi:Protein sensitivity to red light reduced 1 [Vitis vinifera]|uniref:Protein sensitivity to red light reduced 1 n=1 Tax=Vitis vinifera TaxID=29760 RepID=A0A438CU38_VITVI|nr:Protein sensitivity to red light reduced 1 [Vitis vinifera]